jgi:class III poly(R)-hydroxyalkanoic acid synthase PhaE subunit
MTATTATSASFTPPDWFQLQQQYLDNWLALTHTLFKQPTGNLNPKNSPTSPWAEALELWWQALEPSISPEHHAIFRKFIDQGKSYFRFTEEFLKILQHLPNNNDPATADWQQLWEKSFADLKDNFGSLLKNEKSGLGCFWELPLDNWQRTAAMLSALPGDILQTVKDQAIQPGQEQVNQQVEQLFSVPSIGYTQHWQCQLQERGRLWLIYQQAHADYVALFGKIGMRTIDLLRDKIIDLGKQGHTIENLRAIYDLWVDCGEEAYANLARSKEFGETNARLINALMAFKQNERLLIDELLGVFNIPTRREFDTMTCRLQQMRREVRVRPALPDNSRVEAMQKELDVLRAELHILKESTKKTPPRTPKKTTAKKAVSPSTNPAEEANPLLPET